MVIRMGPAILPSWRRSSGHAVPELQGQRVAGERGGCLVAAELADPGGHVVGGRADQHGGGEQGGQLVFRLRPPPRRVAAAGARTVAEDLRELCCCRWRCLDGLVVRGIGQGLGRRRAAERRWCSALPCVPSAGGRLACGPCPRACRVLSAGTHASQPGPSGTVRLERAARGVAPCPQRRPGVGRVRLGVRQARAASAHARPRHGQNRGMPRPRCTPGLAI